MSRLLIHAEHNKRVCGECEHKEQSNNWGECRCRIFNKNLEVKTNKPNFLSFYRLKECIQAEEDYFEILLEGWVV